VREMSDEQPGHEHAELGWLQRPVLALHVVALRDAGDDRRVRARAADVLLFERFDERCVRVARRRVREVLLWTHRLRGRFVLRWFGERFAGYGERPILLQLRQSALLRFVVLVAAVDL